MWRLFLHLLKNIISLYHDVCKYYHASIVKHTCLSLTLLTQKLIFIYKICSELTAHDKAKLLMFVTKYESLNFHFWWWLLFVPAFIHLPSYFIGDICWKSYLKMILLLYGCNVLYEISKFNLSGGIVSYFLILLIVNFFPLRSKFICFFWLDYCFSVGKFCILP